MIGKTFKNLRRLQEILTVFATHGFGEFIEAAGLTKYLSSQEKMAISLDMTPPVRLRKAFEKLGPSFIKLGQMLSVRADLIPTDYRKEFQGLQDSVSPLPTAEIRAQIEKGLDLPLDELFDAFEEMPIGSASIGQVHRARLKDGTDVVMKVRRPGIEALVQRDISILYMLANLLDRFVPQLAVVNPLGIVEEFSRAMTQELDFINEARNTSRFEKNFKDTPAVVIPGVHWQLSSNRVLTLDYLPGVKLSDKQGLKDSGANLPAVADVGLRAFMRMVFEHGFFHGDLHGGNVLVLSDDRIGLLDFGLVGRIDRYMLEAIAGILVALVARDFRRVADSLTEIAEKGEMVDRDTFARDLARVLEPQLDSDSLSTIDTGKVLTDLFDVAQRHGLRVPQDLLLLIRSLIALESMGRELDPNIDVLRVITEFAKTLAVDRYKPERLLIDAVMALRDFADMGKELPRQVQFLLRRLERDQLNLGIQVRDARYYDLWERVGFRLSCALVASGGLVAASVAGSSSLPGAMGLLFSVSATGLLVASLARGLWDRLMPKK